MRASSMPDSERTAMEYDAMGAAYAAVNEEGSANAYYERPATIDLIGDPAPEAGESACTLQIARRRRERGSTR